MPNLSFLSITLRTQKLSWDLHRVFISDLKAHLHSEHGSNSRARLRKEHNITTQAYVKQDWGTKMKCTSNFQSCHEQLLSTAKKSGLILAVSVLLPHSPVQSICHGVLDTWPCNDNPVLTSAKWIWSWWSQNNTSDSSIYGNPFPRWHKGIKIFNTTKDIREVNTGYSFSGIS